MPCRLLRRLHDLADAAIRAVRCRLTNALHPAATRSLLLGAPTNLMRLAHALVARLLAAQQPA